jgi:hypothetical protein
MFGLGAFGFLHELILGGAERPFLLALSGALMGLPFVLAADGKIGSINEPNQKNGSPLEPNELTEEERWSHLP